MIGALAETFFTGVSEILEGMAARMGNPPPPPLVLPERKGVQLQQDGWLEWTVTKLKPRCRYCGRIQHKREYTCPGCGAPGE